MVRLLLIRVLLPLLAFQGGAGISTRPGPLEFGSLCPSKSTVTDEVMKAAATLREQKQLEASIHCQARAADIAAQSHDSKAETKASVAESARCVRSR